MLLRHTQTVICIIEDNVWGRLFSYIFIINSLSGLRERTFSKENIGYIRDLVYRMMNVFNITKEDIINLVYTCPESYNDMKIGTFNMGYKFVETTSFRDFILKL